MEDDDAFLYGAGEEETSPSAAPSAPAPDEKGGTEDVPSADANGLAKVSEKQGEGVDANGDGEDAGEEGEADDDEDEEEEEGEEEEESDDDLEIITEAPLDGSGAAATAAAYSRVRPPHMGRVSGGPAPRQVSNANIGSGGLTSEYTPLSRAKPLPDSPANAARQGTPSAAGPQLQQQQPYQGSIPPTVPVTSLGLLGAKLEPQYAAYKDLGPEVAPGPPPSTAPRLELSPRRAALHIDPGTGLSTAPDGEVGEDDDEPDGPTLYEVDPSSYADRPWRRAGADLTDYFNYGFNEESWRLYMERKRELMKTREDRLREREEERERERIRARENEEEKRRKAEADAAEAAAKNAREAQAARDAAASAAAGGGHDDIPNHDQLLRQLMNMMAPGMPPPQQINMLQQMGVVNHHGRLVPQMLHMMGMFPGGGGGPGGGGPSGPGAGPNQGMMGMGPPPSMGGMPPMSMGMGMNMNQAQPSGPGGMGMGMGGGMQGGPAPPGGPRADRRIPSGPAGQQGLPHRPPTGPAASGPLRMPSGPAADAASMLEDQERPSQAGEDENDDRSKTTDQDGDISNGLPQDQVPPPGPAAQTHGRAPRSSRGARVPPGTPTGPSGGNGRPPPTGPAAERNRNSGPATLPPNVPTGPRGAGKGRRYNDRDTVPGAPDALDYGASNPTFRREEREASSPPPRSVSGRDDDDRRSSRRRGGRGGGDRSPHDERDRSDRDWERERERERDDRDRRESSGHRNRERDRSVSEADERRDSNGADGSREKARAERRAGKGEGGAGSKRGREDDDEVASTTSTRRRR
ncbi:unnamed protein product [Tilletia controversa]|uniref:Pre-mRNA polyadenylation factor Fip1 domain-containing protein n=3 Tax=Tilletia TaxID=13289 RepID=A0A8X7N254_9BASI|nr:hypothetical protein CF336_g253 [Tilletia laevis]KAE8205545.1 hypothetical protein CF328_g448 [Tilletia controversa]KAE8265478.1 hypothetical protein A4X03_0g240 [Tilletia caries]KAE8208733.1 hypothetical protein CF335_g202 [Tilletia laevis]KAE8256140.1 hypothetical protein A4X06_0g51 [Tilletia controversa]